MRRPPGQHERYRLTLPHREARRAVHAFALHGYRAADHQQVQAGDRGGRFIVDAADPGHRVAVVEADRQHGLEVHAPLESFHDARDPDLVAGHRHEVDHACAPRGGMPFGLEHEAAVDIATGARGIGIRRRDTPAAVVLVADQRRETGRRIEPRKACPVDRPVPGHQCRAAAVAEHRVVFDPGCHAVLAMSWAIP